MLFISSFTLCGHIIKIIYLLTKFNNNKLCCKKLKSFLYTANQINNVLMSYLTLFKGLFFQILIVQVFVILKMF